jgi:glycosyltransferase involved in cell wall biosynthesis
MPDDRFRILLVEGSLMGGYEMGLETAVGLVELLNNAHRQMLGKPVELIVAGQVISDVLQNWRNRVGIPLVWVGLVPAEHIPELDRSAHMLYSADINAACPNAVIEALACGTPVLAFDTGALPEMVTDGSGRVVAYGSNPWKLEKPDLPALAECAVEILLNQARFRTRARQRAETLFGLDKMVSSYLTALYPS